MRRQATPGGGGGYADGKETGDGRRKGRRRAVALARDEWSGGWEGDGDGWSLGTGWGWAAAGGGDMGAAGGDGQRTAPSRCICRPWWAPA